MNPAEGFFIEAKADGGQVSEVTNRAVVETQTNPQPPDDSGAWLPVRVIAREDVTDDVVTVVFGLADGRALPTWTPGAHIDVALPDGLVRQYSLCGHVDDADLRIAVLRQPNGRGGSRQVHDELTIGAHTWISAPRNNFPLDDAHRYIFIAGGIGITPILPMLDHVEVAGREWHLVFGGRTRASIPFGTHLRERFGERVKLWPQDEEGLINVPRMLANVRSDTLVYCCGPEALIAAVETVGRDAGWQQSALRRERFTPLVSPERNGCSAIEVECSLSGITLRVAADESILSAARKAGLEVPSSCEEGVCGSCETFVLAGEVEHRDAVLTEQDRERNDSMMICVSRARSGRLVVDL